ncbi:hypothetical protein LTR53_000559 [Teratosphaeriaceae sp. CCFEE 6253]|nr:hypothetical protein LTR53_000559 [Teratosphaeriaceae sp. CCFEE 6253]
MAAPFITVGNDTSRTPPGPDSSPQAWEIYALTQGDKATLAALVATVRKASIRGKWHLVLRESKGEEDEITMTVRLMVTSTYTPLVYHGSSILSIGDQRQEELRCDNVALNFARWYQYGRECHLATKRECGLAWRRFLARLWCAAFPKVPIKHGLTIGDAEDNPDPAPSEPLRKKRRIDLPLLAEGEGGSATAWGVGGTSSLQSRAKEGRDKSSALEVQGEDDDDDHVKGEVEGGASVMAAMTEAVEKAVNEGMTGAASKQGGEVLRESGPRAFWLLYDRDGKFEWEGKMANLDLDDEAVAKMVSQGYNLNTNARHVTLPPTDVLKESQEWKRKWCFGSCSETLPFIIWSDEPLDGGGTDITVDHISPEKGETALAAIRKERVEMAAGEKKKQAAKEPDEKAAREKKRQAAKQAELHAEQSVAKHTSAEEERRDSASAQSEGTGRVVGAASSPSEEKPQVVDVASRLGGEIGNIWCVPGAASRIVASLLPLITETRFRDSEYSRKR